MIQYHINREILFLGAVVVYGLFLVFVMVIVLCSCTKMNGSNTVESSSPLADNEYDYSGLYLYDYEYDTDELIEDYYIVLEDVNGNIQGRYYGKSDDFDSAREGYYPGFFVSGMKGLKITENEISFSIELQASDLFTKPVNIEYKSSQEIDLNDNPAWDSSQILEGRGEPPKSYNGKISNGEIVLTVGNESRVFIRQ